jgi:hypothetical protein
MAPYKLYRRIPLVGRLYRQRDEAAEARGKALGERDDALRERDEAAEARGKALGERDDALRERDEAAEARGKALGERDDALRERDEAVEARGKALGERDDALRERDETLAELKRLARLVEKKSAVSTVVPVLPPPFLERLQAAYKVAVEGFSGSGNSMWSTITQWRSDVHEALLGSDRSLLGELLANPTRTKLYWGVDDLYERPPWGVANREHLAAYARERLIELAISMGVLRRPNPEGGTTYARGMSPESPPNEAILAKIDAYIGQPIDFPNPFAGEVGLSTSRGIACHKAINAIYQAVRLTQMSTAGLIAPRFLEIGAGMGRTAYYARRFGVRTYTIVDLPLALIGQALFLGLVLGDDQIWFQGEKGDGEGKFRLLTPLQFHTNAEPFQIVLNVDSMPEMDPTHVKEYFARMQRDRAQFLSINHEANEHTVHDLAPARSQVHRRTYPLRAGYVEEMFDFRLGSVCN